MRPKLNSSALTCLDESMASSAAKKFERVLAIETSCDDTSVAVVGHDGWVIGMKSANQNQAHAPFGGVVPEIASRNHSQQILPLIDSLLTDAHLKLTDLDGIVMTNSPGLIGSLLVGVVTGKTLAMTSDKPILGVNHLEGHLLAPFLRDADYAPPENFAYPYLGLAISGGHTSLYRINALGDYEVLGRTIDDAAGEAYDKFAKLIGLGFPGGVFVDQAARLGKPDRFAFPRPMLKEDHFCFSFSGLKSSALRRLEEFSSSERAQLASEIEIFHQLRRDKKLPTGLDSVPATASTPVPASASTVASWTGPYPLLADLCASYQEAIVDVLLDRIERASQTEALKRVVLTGGVSANSRLRERAGEWALRAGVQLVIPPLRYCTDNAAMIGLAGILRMNRGETSLMDLGPQPKHPLGRVRPGTVFPGRVARSR